jgi:4-hydroxybenzoate polyprenyltransferase
VHAPDLAPAIATPTPLQAPTADRPPTAAAPAQASASAAAARNPAPPRATKRSVEPGDTAAPIPSFARKPVPAPPRPAPTAHPADTSTRSAKTIDWLLGHLPAPHRARIREYLVLMRMDRPVGALLLLWPTWWALWFAAGDFPPPGALFIFTLGVFVMRSAGCVINDYADHGWLDARVERTRGRPMAAGRVSKREALLLFGGLLAFAFVLVLFTNALTIKLSFVGAALAAVYPFTKRVTHLAQVVLGAAFGWSIPMAFAAVTGTLPPLCWLLFLANVLFSVIYDTEYAMVDRDDDLRVGAKSTAILFGDADRVIIGVLMGTFLLAMLLAGTRAELSWPYFAGLAGATGLFGWQQWLIRGRAREACFAAFRNNNWVGFVLWIGLVLALAIR